MIIKDHLSGDVHEDLKKLSQDSMDRRAEPADPAHFIEWVRESLREHRETLGELQTEHQNLLKAADIATIGLKRLESLVKYLKRDELENMQNLHRTFMHNHRNAGYTLDKCKRILDETTTTWQLVAETLMQPLADRHKKIGMQKEIGLRLRDVEFYYNKCKEEIADLSSRNRQLSQGIQELMHTTSVKLPPDTQKQIEMEDQVKQLALDYGKSLRRAENRATENISKRVEATKIPVDRKSSSLGNTPETTKTPDSVKITVSATDSKKYIYCGLAVVAGLTLGCVIFSK